MKRVTHWGKEKRCEFYFNDSFRLWIMLEGWDHDLVDVILRSSEILDVGPILAAASFTFGEGFLEGVKSWLRQEDVNSKLNHLRRARVNEMAKAIARLTEEHFAVLAASKPAL